MKNMKNGEHAQQFVQVGKISVQRYDSKHLKLTLIISLISSLSEFEGILFVSSSVL